MTTVRPAKNENIMSRYTPPSLNILHCNVQCLTNKILDMNMRLKGRFNSAKCVSGYGGVPIFTSNAVVCENIDLTNFRAEVMKKCN